MATCTTTASGSLTDPTKWDAYPGAADDAVVLHTMTMNGTTFGPVASLTVDAGSITTDGTCLITVTGAMLVKNGGGGELITRATGNLTITAATLTVGADALDDVFIGDAADGAAGSITINGTLVGVQGVHAGALNPTSGTITINGNVTNVNGANDTIRNESTSVLVVNGNAICSGGNLIDANSGVTLNGLMIQQSGALGGNCILWTGGSCTVTAPTGGTHTNNSSHVNGRLIIASTAGTLTMTGNVAMTGNGGCVLQSGSAFTGTFSSGVWTISGTNAVGFKLTAGAATITLNVLATTSGTGAKLFATSSTALPIIKMNTANLSTDALAWNPANPT